MIAGLACHGKDQGNIERDFARRMKKLLNISVDPYELSVNISDGSIVKIDIFVPHDLFGALWWEHTDVAEQRMIGPDGVREFWQIAWDYGVGKHGKLSERFHGHRQRRGWRP